ncbi:MAG: hypothetical protein MUF71_18325 [Candidatus Kapabacteria bacterium]|nr:hypothetical protein [Candidatus Kapabacteria bacterium]
MGQMIHWMTTRRFEEDALLRFCTGSIWGKVRAGKSENTGKIQKVLLSKYAEYRIFVATILATLPTCYAR